MSGFNSIVLMGNLTRTPEMRHTPSGTAVCNFGLAVNRKFSQDGDAKEEVCYVDVVVFGKLAEIVAQYKAKGDQVLVDGRLQQRQWETDDGQKRSKHEVVANQVVFIGGGKAS